MFENALENASKDCYYYCGHPASCFRSILKSQVDAISTIICNDDNDDLFDNCNRGYVRLLQFTLAAPCCCAFAQRGVTIYHYQQYQES
jgi:hypothetical protein